MMQAKNAAMDDDDNEAGMADCDCLSEYQDDAGEWWHTEIGDPRDTFLVMSLPLPEYSTQGGPRSGFPLGILWT